MTPSQYKFVSKYLQIFVKENFEIKDITHGRPTFVFVVNEEGVEDCILSKDEYYRGIEGSEEAEYSYGDVVSSSGGFTRVTLVDKNGKEFVGKHSFKKEKFVKSKGVVRAISNALKYTGALEGFNEFINKVSKETGVVSV